MSFRHYFLSFALALFSLSCFAQKAERLLIGFAHVANNNPYYLNMEQTAIKEAAKFGIDLEIRISNDNQALQNSQILELISKGVKGIIVNPVSEYGVMPAIKKAKELEIPVIVIDRPMYGDFLAYVGIDQWEAGQLQGQHIVELLPQGGNLILLIGIPGEPASVGREQGMLNILENQKNKGHYNILASYRADYVMQTGYEKMNEAIKRFGSKIQLVYALNDAMALGALKALKEAKMPEVMVLGIDGQNEALNEIAQNGQYKSTVINNPNEITKKALSLLREYLKTKKAPSNSKVITGTILVTKKNVKKIQKEGVGF